MIKVADLNISHNGCGLYALKITGTDAAYFRIIGTELYFLPPQTELAKTTYTINIVSEDPTGQQLPKTVSFTLNTQNCPISTTTTTTTTTTLPPPVLSGVRRMGLTHPISNVLTGINLSSYGYDVIHAWNADLVSTCNILLSVNKFGYGGNISGNGMGYTLNQDVYEYLETWVRAGGIYMYQTEMGIAGNSSVANAAMIAAGSSLRSSGGVSSSNGPTLAQSTNSPCVNGIQFYTGASARISGGVNLVYDPIFGQNPSILRGEYVGNGCVLLLGDTHLLSQGTIFTPLYPSWLEFVTRLMTIPPNQLL